MKTATFAASAVAIALSAGAAQAEFIYGGFLQLERRAYQYPWVDGWTDHSTSSRGNIALGYQLDDLTVAMGANWNTTLGEGDPLIDWPKDRTFLLSYGPATLTYGDMYGAGNMISEDYFTMSDATDDQDHTLRLDLALENFHLAISNDLERRDELEIGLATQGFGHFVRVGYESDTGDLGVIVGKDMGGWGYHLATLQDLNDSDPEDDQVAATLLYDVNDNLRLAANIVLDSDLNVYGRSLAAWYELDTPSDRMGPVTLRIAYDEMRVWDEKQLTLGIDVPFGKPLPAAYERRERKRFVSGYGFY